jgi:hypothetical protein
MEATALVVICAFSFGFITGVVWSGSGHKKRENRYSKAMQTPEWHNRRADLINEQLEKGSDPYSTPSNSV